MEFSSKEALTESIKRSKSPKMAVDGVKMLLGSTEDYSDIFKAVLEEVWLDATLRNRAIERKAGRNELIKWPPRTNLEESECQLISKKIKKSRNPAKEMGKVLASYNELTIKRIYQILSDAQ